MRPSWHSVLFFLFFASAVMTNPACAQDGYEPDNTPDDGTVIIINNLTPQLHDLHIFGDQDWIKFYALNSTTYQVELTNVGSGADLYIELFDQDGTSSLMTTNDTGNGGAETLLWYCDQEGIYFVRVGHVGTSTYGQGSDYQLELITPDFITLPGYLSGTIQNKKGVPVPEARIKAVNTSTGFKGSGISLPDGSYIICLESGNCNIEVAATGYSPVVVSGSVPGTENIVLNTIPVARPDQVKFKRGATVSGNVLQNDSDGDDDPLVAVLDSNVSHGTLDLSKNGQFTYVHDGGKTTSDSFAYHAHDGRANSNTVNVSIVIRQIHLPCLILLLKDSSAF